MKAVVVGAGLAGCEAAWVLANGGVSVELIEMKPYRRSPAHHTDMFAELVCSNSLKAARLDSAAGLLKQELRLMDSLCMRAADRHRVAAGGALAVDRTRFSGEITERISAHPNIRIITREQADIPKTKPVVIATGPLTDRAFAREIRTLCGE
ncbi:MAG TPA: methylenetetrahydrofolate--tRNA-(uracil(54)-C(5))-methyltransferase (FADH(2)-oxidizing) TrmFO, partial [Ruminococcaceae bacterium]|nr:methylenetetrahydrofolate--tRNA-(uracil(54)-C(5))-methyltransferase (FADH(2)-oxidizing) TrmFO [Oscillospiraceae bacterium]